jgi:YqjK-like protein
VNESRALALARRQQQLLARSERLREQLASDMRPWQRRLDQADQASAAVHSGWQWLRAHPEVPAAAVALLAVLRPRRALALAWRWGRRGWWGWQLWRRVQRQAAGQGVDLARLITRR